MEGSLSEEELLLQVQSLVSDSLKVVSYKWLSRNFSLSSNAAKRLLQTFAKQNESLEIEIVYAISGWTKNEPCSYAIQLVPKIKLEEAKAALKETSSIHVYSVQRCLPKDPAQLWSADFVQAEQLFKETSSVNNCLRDNRFSAVMCDLVQRSSTRKPISTTSPPQQVSNGAASTSSAPKGQVPAPPLKNSVPDVKDATGGKKPLTTPSMPPKTTATEAKESSGPGSGGKRKAAATASVGGGALASMWGKAPTKPPKATVSLRAPSVPAKPSGPPVSAEAGILAMEEDASSEDDVPNDPPKKGQGSNVAGRRRRMIVDDDDSGAEADDVETIIRISSPDPPEERKPAVTGNRAATNGNKSDVNQKKMSPREEVVKVDSKPPKIEPVSKAVTSRERVESSLHPVENGSKRKRVLKTRIDERGREVSEVVWEIDGVEQNVDNGPALKHSTILPKQTEVKPLTERPQIIQKQPMAPSKNTTSKPGSKGSSKASGKPAKGQGNIMSFFKKT